MRRSLVPALGLVLAALLVVTPVSAAPVTPSWVEKSTIYEVNIRQYTQEGTFAAFAKHLPRLKALGVDVLWLMPIQPVSVKNRKGTLGSPYAVADYLKVNPDYGTDADFAALVEQAHALGMHVILDWVANHTGWDNPWLANPGWYTQDSKGNVISPAGTDWTDVADLNYDNAAMRAAMIAAMRKPPMSLALDRSRWRQLPQRFPVMTGLLTAPRRACRVVIIAVIAALWVRWASSTSRSPVGPAS